MSGLSDYDNDGYCGFQIVEAREIDTIGTEGIIKKIHERVGHKNPVYLSIDIDTLDPAFAPATGTPETGGWSTRELRTIVRGLKGINLVAADASTALGRRHPVCHVVSQTMPASFVSLPSPKRPSRLLTFHLL